MSPALTASRLANTQDCVILLHGLGRTSTSMIWLANDLKRAGYQVINQSYPSRHQQLMDIASGIAPRFEKCRTANRIHVVTHSMGAIVLRQYLALHQHSNLGRAVLLGPPNQGSEVVDAWGKRWWFRWINGPAGADLGTSIDSAPQRLPSLPMPFAVIAGSRQRQNLFLPKLPMPHDGKVSVASTHLQGESAHLVVPVGHTWLMTNPGVRRLVLRYLQTGDLGNQASSSSVR